MKHKWHDEIVAWAGDKTCIEVNKAGIWFGTDYPQWDDADCEFRIKPQPKQPKYVYVYYKDKVYFLKNKDASNRYYIGKIEVQDD